MMSSRGPIASDLLHVNQLLNGWKAGSRKLQQSSISRSDLPSSASGRNRSGNEVPGRLRRVRRSIANGLIAKDTKSYSSVH